jgi:hypothetical protein
VNADDGSTYVLRHDTASGVWELAGLVAQEPRLPRSRRTLH